MKIVLISLYELGRQPFGLASPAAWLAQAGATVTCLDLSTQQLDRSTIAQADLIAIYLPMHTATRIALPLIPRLKTLNPQAHICCYGLYAPLNQQILKERGAHTIISGEFEKQIVSLYQQLKLGTAEISLENGGDAPLLARQTFLPPDRSTLPPLDDYAQLEHSQPTGTDPTSARLVGYTETTRGCKHLCRHCPIVPVYNGQFRIVQRDVVLTDIRNQIAAGATHITFGDPDFFNGPGHVLPIIRALHDEFPTITYDVTIKVEHLLQHARHLPTLKQTGCLFITTAVESLDDHVLDRFAKGHTRADFLAALDLANERGLTLNPTFVTFHPWTTLDTYANFLRTIAQHNLIDHVAPIQYAIRLLIPAGSKLLELIEVDGTVNPDGNSQPIAPISSPSAQKENSSWYLRPKLIVEEFDEEKLVYPWTHANPAVDQLHADLLALIQKSEAAGETRHQIFTRIWAKTQAALKSPNRPPNLTELPPYIPTVPPPPRLTEPWYC